jgi:hypothetical protein
LEASKLSSHEIIAMKSSAQCFLQEESR